MGFITEEGNAGRVYIGSYTDVASGSGFPVPDTGIALDVNQKENPQYASADSSGDALRWIIVL
jgi:hypothetical protein